MLNRNMRLPVDVSFGVATKVTTLVLPRNSLGSAANPLSKGVPQCLAKSGNPLSFTTSTQDKRASGSMGRDHYLGTYGSEDAQDAYDDLMRDWLIRQKPGRLMMQVDDLCLLYMDHAKVHYRKDGEETSEVHCIQIALRKLIALHGQTLVRHFSPKKLKAVRDTMIDAGYVRVSINQHMGRIKRMFAWAVSEEHIPVAIYQALLTVKGLQQGRSKAIESKPVKTVPDTIVEATLPHLTSVLQTMVRLQLLTGMRPDEVCAVRPCDVSITTNGVWEYRPESHKTEHHGKERSVFIGQEGQELLRPYLNRDPDSYCFSPIESEAERNAKRRANRKSPMTPSQSARVPKGRVLKDRFTDDTYNRAIRRACELAFGMPMELRDVRRSIRKLEEDQRESESKRLKEAASAWRQEHCWHPNQLRHNLATELRKQFGIEGARVVLGHSSPTVTEIYAERDNSAAARIMAEVG